jgi:hypothetical protein
LAYNYLEADNLADALNDSEEYMRGYYEPIPELQRITRGRPGKIPAGKPRVTDGTLAGIRRETPKQIIQQLPTGKVIIRNNTEMQDTANAVLTDVILANANSGGTPYAKAKRAIKQTIDVGSAWAECFYNRRGDVFHADYRIKYYRDVLFEKGKVSEFDTNYMLVIDWMTEGDIKAIIWQEKQRKVTKSEYDLKALQELLDKGPSDKDENNKTPADLKANSANGYFKLVRFMQIGVDATFYTYAPTIKKVVKTCTNKDPRGIIPVHGLVPEDDDDNPLGEPLAAISAGKQNLLDFDMQMYQYGQGMGYSPTIKKWGNTPDSKIKISPDNVIGMNGNKQTDDFETVDIGTSATANFANNYGLIKSQILNEMGRRTDTSISATSGNPGFSKTSAGVKDGRAVTDVSDNDLNKSYELWQGRVFETLLNIHFAESQGTKEIDLEPDTMKRYKFDTAPKVDYSKDFGKIKFVVDASTSKAADNDAETTKLTALLEIKAKYQGQADDKFMLMYNQIVKNAGVDDPEKLLYTDEEIQGAMAMRQEQAQMAHETAKLQLQQAMNPPQAPAPVQAAPPPPKSLGESVAWKPGDLKPSERAQALQQVGIEADMSEDPTPNEIAQATDTATKIDKHTQDSQLAVEKHLHDQSQAQFSNVQADRSQTLAETQAQQAAEQAQQPAEAAA